MKQPRPFIAILFATFSTASVLATTGVEFRRFQGQMVELAGGYSSVEALQSFDEVVRCAARCQMMPSCDGFYVKYEALLLSCLFLEASLSLIENSSAPILFMKPNVYDRLSGKAPEVEGPTTPSWDADCFLMGKDYKLLNNLIQMENVEHAVECQRLCQLLADCEHFTFHFSGETKGHCYLKSSFGLSGLHDVDHSISGPRLC